MQLISSRAPVLLAQRRRSSPRRRPIADVFPARRVPGHSRCRSDTAASRAHLNRVHEPFRLPLSMRRGTARGRTCPPRAGSRSLFGPGIHSTHRVLDAQDAASCPCRRPAMRSSRDPPARPWPSPGRGCGERAPGLGRVGGGDGEQFPWDAVEVECPAVGDVCDLAGGEDAGALGGDGAPVAVPGGLPADGGAGGCDDFAVVFAERR